jgi:hypothetical protein
MHLYETPFSTKGFSNKFISYYNSSNFIKNLQETNDITGMNKTIGFNGI